MAKVTDKEIRHLAQLAKLTLDEQKLQNLSKEITAILDYVARLQKAQTKGLRPISQVTGLKDVWRKDEVKPSSTSPQELLKNAPATQDGYVKVKRVL
jgi:aspartyl-tRNA(Asn)/glutamyl-tRNA(Gln) amidotransferase subunit C